MAFSALMASHLIYKLLEAWDNIFLGFCTTPSTMTSM